MALGERIKTAREAQGVSLDALADEAELTQGDLRAFEADEREPEDEQLWNIAREVEPAAFFEKPYQAGPLLKCISKILHDRARTSEVSQPQQRRSV